MSLPMSADHDLNARLWAIAGECAAVGYGKGTVVGAMREAIALSRLTDQSADHDRGGEVETPQCFCQSHGYPGRCAYPACDLSFSGDHDQAGRDAGRVRRTWLEEAARLTDSWVFNIFGHAPYSQLARAIRALADQPAPLPEAPGRVDREALCAVLFAADPGDIDTPPSWADWVEYAGKRKLLQQSVERYRALADAAIAYFADHSVAVTDMVASPPQPDTAASLAELEQRLGMIGSVNVFREALRLAKKARLSASPKPDATSDGPRWRHKKRGTVYTEIGRARVQAASDGPIGEDDAVVVYRSEDGTLWAREQSEFEDGRFEPAPTPPTPDRGEG